MAKVEVERRDRVTVVRLNRPEVHNAIDAETSGLLHEAIEAFAADEEARVLVVTGAGGRSFCSGADLLDGPGLFAAATSGDELREPLGFASLDPGKPTVAAIEGHCLAGGLELACWCDWRVVGETAQFGILNRRWGIPLVDGGTQRLPRIVGLGNALYLIETGVRIGARRALAMGLVQEVVPDGTALDRAVDLAAHLADYPQSSLRADRSSALTAQGQPLAAGLDGEVAGSLPTLNDPELAAGLERFASGDRPSPPHA
jgi:enoyl-CoA hydratase